MNLNIGVSEKTSFSEKRQAKHTVSLGLTSAAGTALAEDRYCYLSLLPRGAWCDDLEVEGPRQLFSEGLEAERKLPFFTTSISLIVG